jgi:hypothetical protein
MATSPDDPEPTDDLEPEYDFRSLRGVVRGKYAERYRERLRVVRLAADVSTAFADEAAVNSALREYITWRQQQPAGDPALLLPDDDGKFVAIDVGTGDFEIDDDDYAAVMRLRARSPQAEIWLGRVGAHAAYRMGRRL